MRWPCRCRASTESALRTPYTDSTPRASFSTTCPESGGAADNAGDSSSSAGAGAGDDNTAGEGADGAGTEGGGKGESARTERPRLGEWDVEPTENMSEDELSGLYSRISAMREREVEVGLPAEVCPATAVDIYL